MTISDELATKYLCEEIVHRFFVFLDEGRYGDLLALMTPDATWLRQGQLLRGIGEIRQALEKRSRSQRIRHVISNVVVDVTPDGASGLAYMTAYRYDDGTPPEGAVTIEGPFRMSVVRARFAVGDGSPRIAALDLQTQFEFGG